MIDATNNRLPSILTRLAILVALSVPMTMQSAAGSELIPRTLPELVSGADHIVIGTCLQTTTFWDRGLIITRVDFSVEERLKGPPGSLIQFLIPGGEVDGIRMEAGEMPTVRKGERMLVFLAKNELENTLRVFGAVQGKFDVIRDARDGAWLATNPLVAVTAPSSTTGQTRPLTDTSTRVHSVPLPEMARVVKAWLAENAKPR